MKNQLSNTLKGVKDFWGKLTKKAKTAIIVIVVLVLALAIGITIYLNSNNKDGKVVLYPNATSEESLQVFQILQEQGAKDVQLNEKGQVTMPEEKRDDYVFTLIQNGFTPSVDVNNDYFTSHTGFTATELETIEVIKQQLEIRLQTTIAKIEGIKSSVVTLNIPKTSNYVWDKAKETATASVAISLENGATITDDQAVAIKNYVAFSVPTMEAQNVKVVNLGTGLEVGDVDSAANSKFNSKRIEFEREFAKYFEDQAINILSRRYPDGVSAAANVKIDYEVLKTETKTPIAKDDDGDRFITHTNETYGVNGKLAASGIVGEQNNTDTPTYPAQDPNATGTVEATSYNRSFDFDLGYAIEQMERGEPILSDASIAVIVDDPDFLTYEDDIIELVATATGIETENITVKDLGYTAPEQPEPEPTDDNVDDVSAMPTRTKIIIGAVIAGVLLLIIIIVTVIIIVLRKKSKQKLEEEEQKSEETIQTLQQEIDEHKRALKEAAEATNTKENAITNEVRAFAKENPEITASLIRSMLKEDE